jgi:hypothetical protein
MLTNELVEKFKVKFPEHSEVSSKEYKGIISEFNGMLAQGMIDNRDGVELPEGLGFIFMGSCPATKEQNIDIAKSMEYGVIVNHKNWDSDNKLMKIFYTNQASKYPFSNKQVWAFKAVRQVRKQASDAYKKNWPKYIVVDNQKKISRLFAKFKKRDYILAEGVKVPEGYNEFNM